VVIIRGPPCLYTDASPSLALHATEDAEASDPPLQEAHTSRSVSSIIVQAVREIRMQRLGRNLHVITICIGRRIHASIASQMQQTLQSRMTDWRPTSPRIGSSPDDVVFMPYYPDTSAQHFGLHLYITPPAQRRIFVVLRCRRRIGTNLCGRCRCAPAAESELQDTIPGIPNVYAGCLLSVMTPRSSAKRQLAPSSPFKRSKRAAPGASPMLR